MPLTEAPAQTLTPARWQLPGSIGSGIRQIIWVVTAQLAVGGHDDGIGTAQKHRPKGGEYLTIALPRQMLRIAAGQ